MADNYLERFVCPECGEVLDIFDGLDIEGMTWKCNNCDTVLFGKNIEEYIKELTEEHWYCDNCGANLEEQEGFDDSLEMWQCKECGQMVDLLEDEFEYDEEEYFEDIITDIMAYLDANDIDFELDEYGGLITAQYDTESFAGVIDIEIFPGFDDIEFCSILPMKADESNMGKVGEYLHRVNDIKDLGFFILNYDTGAISHKYNVAILDREEELWDVVEEGLIKSVHSIRAYDKSIGKVMLGVAEPIDLIEELMGDMLEKIQEIMDREEL